MVQSFPDVDDLPYIFFYYVESCLFCCGNHLDVNIEYCFKTGQDSFGLNTQYFQDEDQTILPHDLQADLQSQDLF